MRLNFWGSSDNADNAAAGPSQPADVAKTNGEQAPASTSTTTSTSAPSAPTKAHEPPLSRYERALKEEQKLQDEQYPNYEDIPKCMTLFDEFVSCYALLPQMRNIYRHGELRDCGYKWDDFKYCLSLKSEDNDERRRLWVQRRAEWWAARRIGPSSEDVWDVRDKPLENFPPLVDEEAAQ